MFMRTLIGHATLVTEGKATKGSVVIENDHITDILKENETPRGLFDSIVDATGCFVLPGVIDDHVHFREPGLTAKADMESESRAAAYGGVTSFFDMPNTVPQTTTLEALDEKFKIAAGSIHRSDSVAEMAREMKVSAVQLQRTLDEYNKCAQDNKQDRFGRRTYLQTIDQPPFYWGRERLMLHTTLGGLKTDVKARVERSDGSVISGLYAAGEGAGGIWGSDRLGGTGLLQCLVQGRTAGEEAARHASQSR